MGAFFDWFGSPFLTRSEFIFLLVIEISLYFQKNEGIGFLNLFRDGLRQSDKKIDALNGMEQRTFRLLAFIVLLLVFSMLAKEYNSYLVLFLFVLHGLVMRNNGINKKYVYRLFALAALAALFVIHWPWEVQFVSSYYLLFCISIDNLIIVLNKDKDVRMANILGEYSSLPTWRKAIIIAAVSFFIICGIIGRLQNAEQKQSDKSLKPVFMI